MALHSRQELFCDLSFIESVAAAGGNRFERTRQIRIRKNFSRPRRVILDQVNASGFFVLAQLVGGFVPVSRREFRNRKSIARRSNRLRQVLAKFFPPELVG